MKLYRFTYYSGKIEKSEFEIEKETPKTYFAERGWYTSRVPKSEIDTINQYNWWQSLNPDPVPFINALVGKFKLKNDLLSEQIKMNTLEIEKLNREKEKYDA